MAKIQIKSEKLTPFGGIFSIMERFDSNKRFIETVAELRKTHILGNQKKREGGGVASNFEYCIL